MRHYHGHICHNIFIIGTRIYLPNQYYLSCTKLLSCHCRMLSNFFSPRTFSYKFVILSPVASNTLWPGVVDSNSKIVSVYGSICSRFYIIFLLSFTLQDVTMPWRVLLLSSERFPPIVIIALASFL